MVDHRKKALWARFNMLHDQNSQEKRTRGKLPQRETRGRWECKMVQLLWRAAGQRLENKHAATIWPCNYIFGSLV